jgi:hypothetical protein
MTIESVTNKTKATELVIVLGEAILLVMECSMMLP